MISSWSPPGLAVCDAVLLHHFRKLKRASCFEVLKIRYLNVAVQAERR
jgi:hypothetical protein